MTKFTRRFQSTRIYFHDEDWKFEDEEEEQVAPSPVRNEALDATPLADEELLPASFTRQISTQATTLERKMFSSRASILHPTAWDHDTTMGKLRFRVHHLVDHIITRILTLILVITDITLVLVSVISHKDKNETVYSIITVMVVSYFLIEVLLRIFAWGSEFFHHKLEVIDLVVIVITFVATVVVEALQYHHQIRYAHLITLFRIFRVGLYLKIFYGVWQSVRRAARNLIGQNKRRYVADGYNLDLTYITDRMIAMSFPSKGLIASYRNPIKEVAKFFNEKHPDHYTIWNLCSERHYDTTLFYDNVERLMIDDHNVPKMSELLQFCEDADKWMKSDVKNVLAIHCKGGKGRTGTCVAGYLLFSGQIKTADKALLYFGTRRTDECEGVSFQGVETPSQIRYVQYLERILRNMNGKMPVEKELVLKSLKITGLKEVGNGDGSDLEMQVIMNGEVVYKCPVSGEYRPNRDMLLNKFLYDHTKKLKGDVKFRFVSSNSSVPEDYDDCAFFFWLHTSFVTNLKFYVTRENIGNCHKPKYNHIYLQNFSITLSFAEPLDMSSTVSKGINVSRAAKHWRFRSKHNESGKSIPDIGDLEVSQTVISIET